MKYLALAIQLIIILVISFIFTYSILWHTCPNPVVKCMVQP